MTAPMTAEERESWIKRYEEGPRLFREAYAKVPAAVLKWRPAPGKWTVHDVVCHAADSETNAYARIRYLVAEKDPKILGYDQDRWSEALDYANHPVEVAFAVIKAVRNSTASLLRRLPEEVWSRTGTHSDSGPYSVESWLKIYGEHLEIHAKQIDRNVEAWKRAKVQH